VRDVPQWSHAQRGESIRAGETGVPAGAKIGNVLVAETNRLRNPTFAFWVDGPGGMRMVVLPDPGIMLTPPDATPQMSAFVLPFNLHPAELAGFFKTPSLWGVPAHGALLPRQLREDAARGGRPLRGRVLQGLPDRWGRFIELTEQDRQDIVAFLERSVRRLHRARPSPALPRDLLREMRMDDVGISLGPAR
jgi:hypothetical protein